MKEKQKQHLIDMMKSDEELELYEESTKCYCGHTTYCDCGPEQDFKDIELPQQERPETLEEVEFINSNIDEFYSEEDMKSFGDWCRNGLLNTEYGVEKLDVHLEQWKQFKKK
jgi:hypothetical protein